MSAQDEASQEYRREIAELKAEQDEAIADFREEKKFILSTENEVISEATKDYISKNNKDAHEEIISTSINTLPFIGEGYDVAVLTGGKDPITGEELDSIGRAATVVGLASLVGTGKWGRQAVDVIINNIAKQLDVDPKIVRQIANDHAQKVWKVSGISDIKRLSENLSLNSMEREIKAVVAKQVVKAFDSAHKVVLDNIDKNVQSATKHAVQKAEMSVGNGGKKFISGIHSMIAVKKNTQAKMILVSENVNTTLEPYKAIVEITDVDGKIYSMPKTFFPDSWSEDKIAEEIEHAIKNVARKGDHRLGNEYIGRSIDGAFEIGFYITNGKVASAFPKI
jgi:hypothetical protein